MRELSTWIADRLRSEGWSYRQAEEATGVDDSLLQRIVDDPDYLPRWGNLARIAEGFGVPLWFVLEKAGINLGLESADLSLQRLRSLAEQNPDYAELIDLLREIDPEEVRWAVAYLRTVRARKSQRQDDQ